MYSVVPNADVLIADVLIAIAYRISTMSWRRAP